MLTWQRLMTTPQRNSPFERRWYPYMESTSSSLEEGLKKTRSRQWTRSPAAKWLNSTHKIYAWNPSTEGSMPRIFPVGLVKTLKSSSWSLPASVAKSSLSDPLRSGPEISSPDLARIFRPPADGPVWSNIAMTVAGRIWSRIESPCHHPLALAPARLPVMMHINS